MVLYWIYFSHKFMAAFAASSGEIYPCCAISVRTTVMRCAPSFGWSMGS